MKNEKQKNSIKEQILDKIKKGEFKMHPKFYFFLKAIVVTIIVIILIVIIVFLISFIVFSSENNGAQFLIGSGFKGILSAIYLLPWIFVLIVLIAIILIEKLIKRYKFTYKRPLIYSLLFIVIFGAVCGLIIHKTFLHQGVSCLINDFFYGGPRSTNLPDTHEGRIYKINENEIEIMDLNGQILDAIFPSESFKLKDREFERGDKIIFTGLRKDSVINISSYRKLNCGCGGCVLDELEK